MRQRTEQERRALVLRGGALAALSQHPSWPELEDEVKRKEERLRKHILSRFLSTEAVDQRQVDYLRGFINGMNWLVAVPTSAEDTLERYLKQQGIALAKEALAEAEGDQS
jgi:hypothetical protein